LEIGVRVSALNNAALEGFICEVFKSNSDQQYEMNNSNKEARINQRQKGSFEVWFGVRVG
jgi:hypothetical protein